MFRFPLFALFWLPLPAFAADLTLSMPVDCRLGEQCFVQQYPDLDPGAGVVDPYCGSASYDGHKGTDIRVRTMRDMIKGVDVSAVADGVITGIRKNMPDRLAVSKATQAAVKGRECGNGVVVDHGNGWTSQYCHMRHLSVSVNVGDRVKSGDRLGQMGASGFAEFPHLHLTIRKDGEIVDPSTGLKSGIDCDAATVQRQSMWSAAAAAIENKSGPQILSLGLTGQPVRSDSLVLQLPNVASSASANVVGYGWAINLPKDSIFTLSVFDPSGKELAVNRSDPLERNKATFSLYAGRRRPPVPGTYEIRAEIELSGKILARQTKQIVVN